MVRIHTGTHHSIFCHHITIRGVIHPNTTSCHRFNGFNDFATHFIIHIPLAILRVIPGYGACMYSFLTLQVNRIGNEWIVVEILMAWCVGLYGQQYGCFKVV
eukprot:272396_1